MENFLWGVLSTILSATVAISWRDRRIPRALFRLYAAGMMSAGAIMLFIASLTLVPGDASKRSTATIGRVFWPDWPSRLALAGTALIVAPIVLVAVMEFVRTVQSEADKEAAAPSEQKPTGEQIGDE